MIGFGHDDVERLFGRSKHLDRVGGDEIDLVVVGLLGEVVVLDIKVRQCLDRTDRDLRDRHLPYRIEFGEDRGRQPAAQPDDERALGLVDEAQRIDRVHRAQFPVAARGVGVAVDVQLRRTVDIHHPDVRGRAVVSEFQRAPVAKALNRRARCSPPAMAGA